MSEKQNIETTSQPPPDLDQNWELDEIELDPKEKKYCCDAEKRRRIEQLREEKELERALREFYDD